MLIFYMVYQTVPAQAGIFILVSISSLNDIDNIGTDNFVYENQHLVANIWFIL